MLPRILIDADTASETTVLLGARLATPELVLLFCFCQAVLASTLVDHRPVGSGPVGGG